MAAYCHNLKPYGSSETKEERERERVERERGKEREELAVAPFAV